MSDGGNELEGDKDILKPAARETSVAYDLVEKGIGYEPRSGRIDGGWGDPSLKKPEPEKTAENPEDDKNAKSGDTSEGLPKVTNIETTN